MTARLRVGVVGLGRMGSMHARYVARNVAGARLTAVADFDLDRATRAAAELDAPHVFGSAAELAACRDVDAVLVATPSVRHPDDVIAVAAERKDILCEKPLALTEEGSAAALAAVARAGIRLQVGLMRRHDADYLRALGRLAAATAAGRSCSRACSSVGRDPLAIRRRPANCERIGEATKVVVTL